MNYIILNYQHNSDLVSHHFDFLSHNFEFLAHNFVSYNLDFRHNRDLVS